jgi:hypothetical protein
LELLACDVCIDAVLKEEVVDLTALEETTVGAVHALDTILTKATVPLNRLVWQQMGFLNW